MSVFFLVKSGEEGEIDKTGSLCGFGYVVFSAFDPAFGILQTQVVPIFDRGFPSVFFKESAEIDLAHSAKIRIICNWRGGTAVF